MRILMCCADWGVPLGGNAGSSVHLRSMAKALAGAGHEVRLVVNNHSGQTLPSLPMDIVPFRRFWPAVREWTQRSGGAPNLATQPPAGKGLDTLHFAAEPQEAPEPSWKVRLHYDHLPRVLDRVEEFIFNPRVFGRAVARIMAEFEPDAVYERYALGQTGVAWAARSHGSGVPHLLEVNASLAFERTVQGELSGFWSWWGQRKETQLWRRCQRVFCVSRRLRDLAVRVGADPGRLRVMQNGVDVDAFSPERPKGTLRRAVGSNPEEILIGWLGSLSPGRGAEDFLRILARALPELRDARGVVIGDGRLAGQCRSLASELGISERVVFTGAVEHERVPDMLVDLDLAVASYPKQDGFYFSPLKVAEYLACGLPVVTGTTGGTNPVEDGINGVLVRPGDVAAWAYAVVALCKDRARRTRMGVAARRSALMGPTWEKNARVVEQSILDCRRETVARGRA